MKNDIFDIKKKLLNIYKLLKDNKWFTLVELIVTITILAILWTISFMSFNWYSKNARDWVRISDINNLKKNLEFFVIEKWFYPTPDLWVNITNSWEIAWIQWTIWDNVIKNLRNINKKPTYPLAWNEYTYSITNLKNEYQIWSIYEWTSVLSNNNNKQLLRTKLIQVNAEDKNITAMVVWNYNDKILKINSWSSNCVYAIPSIINSDITETNVIDILNKNLFVYDKYNNLPASYKNNWYTMTWWFNFQPWWSIELFCWTIQELNKTWNMLLFVDNLKNAYSWTIISWLDPYRDLMNTEIETNPLQAKELVTNYLKNGLWWVYYIAPQIWAVYSSCTLDWETIENEQIITAYSEKDIVWDATYECNDRKQIRICADWKITWDSNYQFMTCLKWTPDNCPANTNYTFNEHIYSIPLLNHTELKTNTISTSISIPNWTKTYTLETVTCNDWTLINPQENSSPTISCNTNYHTDDNVTCILDDCVFWTSPIWECSL